MPSPDRTTEQIVSAEPEAEQRETARALEAVAPQGQQPPEAPEARGRPVALASDSFGSESAPRLIRAGALLIIFFQIAYLLQALASPLVAGQHGILALHLLNIAIGGALFGAMFVNRISAHWRTLAWSACAALIGITLAICRSTDDPMALFVSIIALLAGAGALAPWGPLWQATLSALGLASFALLPQLGNDPAMMWLGLVTATLLGQTSAFLWLNLRRKQAGEILFLRTRDAQINREFDERKRLMTEYEAVNRQLRASEAITRRIFENLTDIAIVGRLTDGTFVDVNRGFENTFGHRREKIIGQPIANCQLWVDQKQHQVFLDALTEHGAIRNLEAQFRHADGHIIAGIASGVALELNGEPCAILMIREISDLEETASQLRAAREELGRQVEALCDSQARLLESEAKLRKIFNATVDMITINDLETGDYVDFNQEFVRVTGYKRGAAVGRTAAQLGTWSNRAEYAQFVRDLRSKGEVRNREVSFKFPDGHMMPSLVSATLLELGGRQCVLTIVRDISDIRQAESRLRESEVTLRQIFDNTLDIIAINDLETGAYLEVNKEFTRATGYSREAALGKNVVELALWDDAEQHRDFLRRLITIGEVRNTEVAFRYKSGRAVPSLISAVALKIAGRRCVISIVRDISSIREAEDRVRKSEAALRRVFDSSLDAITINDYQTGEYLEVNQEFIDRTGFSREQVIGVPFQRLGIWPNLEQVAAYHKQLVRDGQVRNLEIDLRLKAGRIGSFLMSAVVVELNGRQCCISTTRDITKIKDTERELVAAREAALAASEAKSEFLSSMSHEIRTPMNSILGMAELLTETSMTTEQRRYVDTLASNGSALLDLINSILDLAKIESGRLSLEAVSFNLRDVVEKLADMLVIRADEKGIELLVRIAPGVPATMVGDSLRLRQVLVNLIGNAIKFTERGEVLIQVDQEPGPEDRLRLRFSVSDTGIGIAAEKIETLFSPFAQADSSTSRKYGGSGLGLAIVRRLVTLMNGTVAVNSQPGQGSKFSFSAEFARDTAARPAPGTASISGASVLVADANSTNRAILRELLETQHANVTEATTGHGAADAVRAAAAAGRPFDAVLIDPRIPGIDAYLGARSSLTRTPGASPPLIAMLYTNRLTADVAHLHSSGINDYVVKPVKASELISTLASVFNRTISRKSAPERTGAPHPEPEQRALRILLADDSRDNQQLVLAFLRKMPYQIDLADDGGKAIEKFSQGRYDLVLMDIQMPGIDGYAATRTIRQWEDQHGGEHCPIIALTASAFEDAILKARAAGCDAHLAKPVSKAALLRAILDAVDAHKVTSFPLSTAALTQ